jgi:predicted amidohydrolase YtcJ
MKKLWMALTAAFVMNVSMAQEADLLIWNANVYTVDPARPKASAVGIKDGKIVFVGSNEELKHHIGSNTKQIDAKGKFLMPGIIEGHGHIHGMGASLISLNLMKVKNWDEIVALVKEAVKNAKPGDWIVGRGWHQEKWDRVPKKNHLGYPYYQELDKV